MTANGAAPPDPSADASAGDAFALDARTQGLPFDASVGDGPLLDAAVCDRGGESPEASLHLDGSCTACEQPRAGFARSSTTALTKVSDSGPFLPQTGVFQVVVVARDSFGQERESAPLDLIVDH